MAIKLEQMRLKAGLLFNRQGLWPFLAAGLFLLAVLFAALVIPGQISATQSAKDELANLLAQQRELRAKPESERMSPAKSLGRTLSDPRDTNAQIGLLLNLANESGVSVIQADYRRSTDTQQNWSQLQIALPIKADYPQLRKFIFSAMAALPSLSLDQMVLKREQPSATIIEAQLIFSLWQKPLEAPALASTGDAK